MPTQNAKHKFIQLTYCMLWAVSVEDKMIFSYFFQKIGFDISYKFMQNVSEIQDLVKPYILHDMSNPNF